MRRFLLTGFVAILLLCMVGSATAELPTVDLIDLSYDQLASIRTSIDTVADTYHEATSSQCDHVLNATKDQIQASLLGCSGFSWPWFDYTYTRDWDFYTLTTSVDYRDKSDNDLSDKVYSEVFCDQLGNYMVYYLTVGDIVLVDNRSSIPSSHWSEQPTPVIDAATQVDLAILTADELAQLKLNIDNEIMVNHTTDSSVTDRIESLTKNAVEQHYLAQGVDSIDWPWFDYSYTCDWGKYTLTTRISYSDNSVSVDKPIYSEAQLIDGMYALTYLKVGDDVLLDQSIASPTDNSQLSMSPAITPEPLSSANAAVTPELQTSYVTVPPTNKVTLAGFNYASATDEELEQALIDIKAEIRSRLKTQVILTPANIALPKGKSIKIIANVNELPEGVTVTEYRWDSSDAAVASVKNGNVTIKGAGTAVIMCTAILSDDTEVDAECAVECIIPITSLSVADKKVTVMEGSSLKLTITVVPDNATDRELEFRSSNSAIVNVDEQGNIIGISPGNATITVTTKDGSKNNITIKVAVTERDDTLKALLELDREKSTDKIRSIVDIYLGKEVELYLCTAFVEHNGNYKTRFNYLLFGIYGDEIMMAGPSFMFKDVSYYDLHLTGSNQPDTFDVGLCCKVMATVDGYEDGMILLDPISIEVISTEEAAQESLNIK